MPIRASSNSSSARSSRSRSSRVAFDLRFFDLAAQTKLHFAGRFFSEGDRDDAIERSRPSGDQADDPTDEGGGFAGPSRRLDKKGRAKILSDSTSCFGVREIGHGSARKARSGSRFPCGFRAARRSS